MWTRTVEICLACWLAISPFVFRVNRDQVAVWATDLACAGLIVIVSAASLWPRLDKLHLANLLVATGLAATALAAGPQPAPPHQNHMVMAFLLAMIAILPTRADSPPRAWRDYVSQDRT